MNSSGFRFLCASLLLLSAAIYLKIHSVNEVFPPRQPLSNFPAQIGAWQGTDLVIDQETRDVLGPGEFLSRAYIPASAQIPGIELFIAYFPSQSTNDTIHSPLHCLPGAGWLPIDSRRVTLDVAGHAPFPANRVVVAKGESRGLVLYWYWAHDRGVASEYWARYFLVRDSIQMHRSDGALIRIISPIGAHETADSVYQRVLPFTADFVPILNDYIPR